MKNIKMIGIDIDGTLVNDQKKMTEITRKVIMQARQQGVKIVICTGRPLSGARQYLKQLKISGDNEYVVGFNGAIAETVSGKLVIDHKFSYENFLKTELLSRKFGVKFQIETPNAIYALNRDLSRWTIFEANLVHLPLKVRTPEEIKPDLKISKTMWVGEPDQITYMKKHLPKELNKTMYVVQTEPVYLEALKKGVNKGDTLMGLAKKLNIQPDEVMALGDQGNDLPMIKRAGMGVAMGNAIKENKAAANFITKTNNENGVAYAIKKFVLKK